MLNLLRLLGAQPEITTVLSQPSPYYIVGKIFRQAVVAGAHNSSQSSHKMAEAQNPNGDTLSSLGKEYATRCEEEGLGVIYGKKNKSPNDDEEEYLGPANAPPESEGRGKGDQVKYKEKAGNESKVSS